jgi:hypothetical protein
MRLFTEIYQPIVDELGHTYDHFDWPAVNTIAVEMYPNSALFTQALADAALPNHPRWAELTAAADPATACAIAPAIALDLSTELVLGLEDYLKRVYPEWPRVTDLHGRDAIAYMAFLALDAPLQALIFAMLSEIVERHPDWWGDDLQHEFRSMSITLAGEIFGPIVRRSVDGDENNAESFLPHSETPIGRQRVQRWMLYGTLARNAKPDNSTLVETRDWLLPKLVDQVRMAFRSDNPRHRQAYTALVARAGGLTSGPRFEGAKRATLVAAATVVLDRWEERQRHRFGRGEGSRTIEVVPSALPWDDSWSWLGDEVRKAAIADLLNEPYPALEHTEYSRGKDKLLNPLDETTATDESLYRRDDDDPLVVLVAEEKVSEAAVQLRALSAILPPAEKALLEALAEQDKGANRGAILSAAEQLRITPSTARARLHSLRKRIRETT